ncbi:GNAT family N-acetyltransferase [Chitinasiproducens palmae]|uniref:Acetyltransferase (GNAT) domain-containing protein n=1 Tax=Chitinasiproducens palmae TaxID=1770053 RepID=A0A1H2PKB3_9BURK|nr:GNAT family N-acetyltransferase [Chitinasiproducens palmae]SDV46421.1 Acetyltransferase (GNAT) domain-containing protein [Chitinasiproducens palmae]
MTRGVLRLRQFNDGDLDAAQCLSRAVGWPHRRDDWAFAARLGHGWVAERAGRVVGTTLYWQHGDAGASIGLVIVSAAERGQGLGARLLGAALDALAGRTVFLNATPAGQPLYQSVGFRACGAIVQCQSDRIRATQPGIEDGALLRVATPSDRVTLAALATAACGMDRQAVVDAVLDAGHAVVIARAGAVQGYAAIRAFGLGSVIGPVIARDTVDARALIGYWLARADGGFVRIDVPAESGLAPWLAGCGLTAVDRSVTMVRGPSPPITAVYRTYAAVTQALL